MGQEVPSLENRKQLAEYFNERGFKEGAEIGVADGRFAEILCQSIPGLELICVDPYKPYEGHWRSQKHQDSVYEKAINRLSKYDVHFIRRTSVEASFDIPDNSLDFVFIDGNHLFDYVMMDIILWTRKVKNKGIVSGHDYMHFTRSGVVEAVNKKSGPFVDSDVDTLDLLANQIALAIYNAQLYRSAKREALQRKALFNVSRQLMLPLLCLYSGMV